MIKNYLKTAFRNIWKMKGYSFLNIFGLLLASPVLVSFSYGYRMN
jgi:hypothetical protein